MTRCSPGQYWGGSLCTPCPLGTYSESTPEARGVADDGVCLTCPAGLTSPEGSSYCHCDAGMYWISDGCKLCPDQSTSEAASTACVCNSGLYWDGSACTPCPSDTYSESTPVALGDPDSSVCQSCPEYSTSLEGSHAAALCLCDPGRHWDGSACRPCRAGTYSSSTPPAVGEGDDSVCLLCTSDLTTLPGSISEASCRSTCPMGYYWSGVECLRCPVDTYYDGDAPATASGPMDSTICVACPIGTISPAGATNQASCVSASGK